MVAKYFKRVAHPVRIRGSLVEASLPETTIGEICDIQASLQDNTVIGRAQVLGFNKDYTVLSLLNDNLGYSRSNLLFPTGKHFTVNASEAMLGGIVNANGELCGRLDDQPLKSLQQADVLTASGKAKDFTQRKPISQIFATGVRAIDSLLTCGKGQRMGIFAAAGCGKTSLMEMIIEHSQADVYVIGLIGERGREVTELVEKLSQSVRREQIVLVYATSDRACVERCNAAQIATTLAEYFADRGNNVLLFVDSITRYARALRDVALSMGELPARRGYPASVFEALPRLLERPGNFHKGAITAFYTVLIENEEEPDVIGDEVRSILDGHIYLSKTLAAQNHYPAIDVLQSISRVFTQVASISQQKNAASFRQLLVRQRDMQLYLDLGEYRPGENPDNDDAFERKKSMVDFLVQNMHQTGDLDITLDLMNDCLA